MVYSLRLWRQLLNQRILFPFTPYWFVFLIRMWWSAVSNAFERSIKTLRKKWLFSKLFLIWSICWIIACPVECPSLNQIVFYKVFHLLLNIQKKYIVHDSLCEKCPNTEFFSGPYFPTLGLNTERYGEILSEPFFSFSS